MTAIDKGENVALVRGDNGTTRLSHAALEQCPRQPPCFGARLRGDRLRQAWSTDGARRREIARPGGAGLHAWYDQTPQERRFAKFVSTPGDDGFDKA